MSAVPADPPAVPAAARPTGSRFTYQPALDGWRGIGILAVLVYHGGFRDWIPGAFLWIDGFFTVSAFLIATLLLQEHDRSGRIDLVGFWARRVRRLAPALILVLAGMALFATVADRSQLAHLPGDVLATLFYVSNWRFVLSGADYFAAFSSHSPLEHTWSLAIEEQFYLLFPLLLVAVFALARRRPHRALIVVASVGAVASAAWMAWLGANGATTSRLYFGTDTRVQSLLVGVVLAVVLHLRPLRPGSTTARWVGGIGASAFVVLLVTQLVIDESSSALYRGGFLTIAVAQACVFAALLLPGRFQRLLASRPLVWVGALAYGLYLFHYPLYLWLTPERTHLQGGALLALRMAATFAVAVPVYRLIEQPVRTRRWPAPGTIAARVLWPVSVAVVALVALGVTPPSVEPSTEELATGIAVETVPPASTGAPGGSAPATPTIGEGTVAPSAPPPPPRIAVVGDSTGERLAMAVDAWGAATPQIVSVGNASRVGCPLGRGGAMHTAADALGPVNPACDWSTTAITGTDGTERPTFATVAAQWRPDLVLVSNGLWDVADRQLPGDPTWRHAGEPEYDDWLLGELLAAHDALSAAGAHVVWLTLQPWEGATRHPPERVYAPAADPARVDAYNRILERLAAARPDSALVVDLAGWVESTGEDARLRPDGAHLEPETAVEVVNRFLGPALLAQWQAIAGA